MKVTFRPSSSQPRAVDPHAVAERRRDLDAEMKERFADTMARIRHEESRLRALGYDPNHINCNEADRMLKDE